MEGGLSNKTPAKNSPETNSAYACSHCGNILFDANKKFNAGCGFPSFWTHKDDNVKQKVLHTYGRTRTQLLCNDCGAHLGHLFTSKHTPTGLRYCINETSIVLNEA